MNRIKMFKDQEDLKITLTNDNIINIIGTKGSGKTTSSLIFINDDDYIVINGDRLLELPTTEKEDKELANIRTMLKDKYKKIPEGEEFINCYNDIVKYILDKDKKGLIEGNIIQDFDPTLLKGTVIIKRTAIFKSTISSDFTNSYR